MVLAKGFLVIADITGYTAFLTGSELDHAQEILKSLFDTLLETIVPPLIISNFQGDAILAYAPEGNFLLGQTLLDEVENIYYAFAHKLEVMQHNTTCQCQACANIPKLDLKVFVHYGEYVVQDLHGRPELSGTDVITVHLMMKNEVKEKTGYSAYALFTQVAIAKLGMEAFTAEMKPLRETYDHIGEVPMYAYDLRAVWLREREKRRVLVSPESAWFVLEMDLPAPPSLVWDYYNDPEKRRRALGVPGVTVSGMQRGRMGAGTIYHCMHGTAKSTDFIVVDWRPFEYISEEVVGLPLHLVGHATVHLTPAGEGTRVSVRIAEMTAPNPLVAAIYRVVRLMFKRMFAQTYIHAFEMIPQMIEEDRAAGHMTIRTPRR